MYCHPFFKTKNMYKATRIFTTKGKYYGKGESVTGLPQSEMDALEAMGLIEPVMVYVEKSAKAYDEANSKQEVPEYQNKAEQPAPKRKGRKKAE